MLRRDDPGAVWSQCQRVFCKSRSHQPSCGSFFPEGNLFRSEGLDIGFGRISFHNAHDVPGCANRATLSTSHCRHDLTRPAPLSMWSRMLHNAPALLASITEGISSTRNPGSPPNQLQIRVGFSFSSFSPAKWLSFIDSRVCNQRAGHDNPRHWD